MTPLSKVDVLAAWGADREELLKGQAKSPGLPVAPPAPHKRAPNRLPKDPRRFFDPAEGVSHSATPETVQPITLGDLKQLAQNAPVESIPQRATGVKSEIKAGSESSNRASLRDDAFQSARQNVERGTNNATAVQTSKRLARLRGTRPVHNAPQNFKPV